MGFFVRVLSALNTAREWLSFAGETATMLGLAKRAAAITAGAAVIAAPVVVYKYRQAEPATVAVATAPAGVAQTGEIGAGKVYSKTYLIQPEHRAALDTIIAGCKNSAEYSPQQCDIADAAAKWVKSEEMEARRTAAIRRIQREQEEAEKHFEPMKLPHEFKLVK